MPSNPAKDYYFIHRDTPNTEAIIVEYGFLDSTGDDPEQLKSNWQNYAEAVVRAISEYKGLKYVPQPGSGYYIVEKGDSLWSIAKKNNLTVNELKELNNLNSSLLNVGQVLKIEKLKKEQKENIYIIEKSDTLYSIAKKYNLTVNELKEMNDLTDNNLIIGQELVIVSPNNNDTYIVQKGDTLYSIANKYNISVNKLKELNNLNTNELSVGQNLNVPIKENNKEKYIVKKGDTLYSIAKEFNVTVNDLKELNNLSDNLLTIGQVLLVR